MSLAHTSGTDRTGSGTDSCRYHKELLDEYELLLLDAIVCDKRFIRSDELYAPWKILEERKVAPKLYPFGSRGSIRAQYLAAKYNVRWGGHRLRRVCESGGARHSTSPLPEGLQPDLFGRKGVSDDLKNLRERFGVTALSGIPVKMSRGLLLLPK